MRHPRRTALALLCGAAALVGAAAIAEARPGGGHSFSGSSSSSRSYSSSSSSSSSYRSSGSSSWSSGSDSFEMSRTGNIATLSLMAVMIVGGLSALALSLVHELVAERREARLMSEQLSRPSPSPAPLSRRAGWVERPRARPRRVKLRERDPHFSRIVFEDLAHRLYTAAYTRAAAGGDLDGLAPYLAPAVRQVLRDDLARRGRVVGVVVGSLSVGDIRLDDARASIVVDIESNLSLSAGDRDETLYLVERWTFARSLDAVTRPPERVMGLGCPSCGAPFASIDHRRCTHCDTVVADGRFEWQVVTREVVGRRAMAPTMTRTVVEVGTDDPTITQSDLPRRMQELASGPAGATLDAIAARVQQIFRELNAGWDARDLARIRPVLTDALFDSMRYWLAAHDARGLHNRVERPTLLRIEPARVRRDHFFDAITVRIHAHCLDYTVDRTTTIVSGSSTRPRTYSEYWTLIRGRTPGDRRGDAEQCPSCGAPLRLTMAGNCDHCGSHLTLGEFDWVLSKIEQDESYRG